MPCTPGQVDRRPLHMDGIMHDEVTMTPDRQAADRASVHSGEIHGSRQQTNAQLARLGLI